MTQQEITPTGILTVYEDNRPILMERVEDENYDVLTVECEYEGRDNNKTAHLIAKAFNHTVAKGINPESVEKMRDFIQGLLDNDATPYWIKDGANHILTAAKPT